MWVDKYYGELAVCVRVRLPRHRVTGTLAKSSLREGGEEDPSALQEETWKGWASVSVFMVQRALPHSPQSVVALDGEFGKI